MKALFILPEFYPHSGGGISTYYQHYINAIRAECNEIKVIVGSGYTQADDVLSYDGITVEYLKPAIYQEYLTRFTQYDLVPGFKKNIAAAWAMWQQAKQGDGFDIIECTDFGLGFIPWVIDHKLPVITRLHGSSGQISLYEAATENVLEDNLYQHAELLLLPLADKLITHSKTNQNFWNNLLNFNNVLHIYPVYQPDHTDRTLNYNERENYGLITARIQKWKGPSQLCAAINTMINAPLIKWVGRDMPFTKKTSTSAYLKKQFPGVWGKSIIPSPPLINSEIRQLQQKAKFGIVPSIWDMFNFTCLEFLSSGTLVICSDGAGSAELIEDGKNGFKYKASDLNALAVCIEQVSLLSSEKYAKITQAGFDTIKTRLSADQLVPINLECYKNVVANFNSRETSLFIKKSYAPADIAYTADDVYDQQPIKKLAVYIIKRTIKKII